jgi:hypothetical protein
VVKFAFAVLFGTKDAIINQPKLIGFRIDIDASDNPNPFDN